MPEAAKLIAEGLMVGAVEPGDELAGGLAMNARAGAVVVRMLVGHQLRRLREAAGVTADQAAEEIRASRPKISRMENGRVGFKARDVADLLTLYGVTGGQMRAQLLELARRANTPGWWTAHSDILPGWFEAYLGLEAAASVIRTFELQFVHGLFQTEDYARAVTMLGHQGAPAWEIDSRVSLRMKRQDLLIAADPPRVWSVMDETALRRPVGGRQVIRAQLQHLVEIAALPQVSLQVVPFGHGGHAAAGGSFTILRFAEPTLPDVVYIEHLTSALYLQAPGDLDHYLHVMDHLSAQALTPAATTRYIQKIISQT
jgi:transcriptional regulator with XRE-family HTH domain